MGEEGQAWDTDTAKPQRRECHGLQGLHRVGTAPQLLTVVWLGQATEDMAGHVDVPGPPTVPAIRKPHSPEQMGVDSGACGACWESQ